MKNLKLTSESAFPRSFSFKKDTHVVTGAMQPYCVGMYCVIEDSEVSQTIQLNLPHKDAAKWFKKVRGKFEKDGYKTEVLERRLGDFITSKDIELYIN